MKIEIETEEIVTILVAFVVTMLLLIASKGCQAENQNRLDRMWLEMTNSPSRK